MSQFKFKPGESKKSGMLNFKNPVKEMFFLAVSDDVYKYEPIKHVTMKFNNNIIIDADNLMLSYEQPLKYYTGVTIITLVYIVFLETRNVLPYRSS